ncbi:MAG: hypothetical protein ACPGU6_04905 [Tenacibaculum sp.]
MKKENYCEAILEHKIQRTQSWFMNILIAFDQLGNAFAKGNPDNTISARIGYFMHHENGNPSSYWKLLENIVNFTFKPIDGIEHCFVAYCNDKNEIYQKADGFAKVILLLFVVIFTIPTLIIIIRIIAFIFPKSKCQYQLNGEKVTLNTINSLRKNYCYKD